MVYRSSRLIKLQLLRILKISRNSNRSWGEVVTPAGYTKTKTFHTLNRPKILEGESQNVINM